MLLPCGIQISFTRYDEPMFNLNKNFETAIIQNDLMNMSADKDSLVISERKIDGKPGAVGSGYLPKQDLKVHIADFYVSSSTVGRIYILENANTLENETLMISALKTIHITEAA